MPSITVNTALISIPRFVDLGDCTFFRVMRCPHAVACGHVDCKPICGWRKWCEALMAGVLICGWNELCTFFGHVHTFWFRLAGSTDYGRTQYWNTAKHTPLHTNRAANLPPDCRLEMAGTTTQWNANMAANAASTDYTYSCIDHRIAASQQLGDATKLPWTTLAPHSADCDIVALHSLDNVCSSQYKPFRGRCIFANTGYVCQRWRNWCNEAPAFYHNSLCFKTNAFRRVLAWWFCVLQM